MRKLRKALAVLLSAAMVLGMGSMTLAAPETTAEETAYDQPLTVSGLEAGDVVHFYKVIGWVGDAEGNVTGWKAVAPFDEILTRGELAKVLVDENAVIAEDGKITTTSETKKPAGISSELAGNLARKVNADTQKTDVKVDEGKTEATLENTESGMYMAIITPKDPDVVYNPVFVSADYNKQNPGNVEAVTTATYSDALAPTNKGAAKKSKGTNDKTATKSEADYADKEWTTAAIGDTVHFDIDSTIPGYGKVYTEPFFKLTDTLTDLDLKGDTITVKVKGGDDIDASNYDLKVNGKKSFSISFKADYLYTIFVPTDIVISYDAIVSSTAPLHINQLKNELSTEFSQNPRDEDDHGFKKDTTQHYTFTIGAEGLGLTEQGEGKKTSEIVKVGVDGLGNPMNETTVTSEITSTSTYKAPLAGAKFKLYTDEKAKKEYVPKNTDGTDAEPLVIETDADGRLTITGLDAGIYYLQESEAPAGFVRDTTTHKIEIIAVTDEVTVTEYTEDGETWTTEDKSTDPSFKAYTYKTDVLKSSTIKIDGIVASTYNFTNNGSEAVIDWDENPPVEIPSQIKNVQGTELPATGGMGTTLFYVIGSILVIGAGIVLVAKKRMSAQ